MITLSRRGTLKCKRDNVVFDDEREMDWDTPDVTKGREESCAE